MEKNPHYGKQDIVSDGARAQIYSFELFVSNILIPFAMCVAVALK